MADDNGPAGGICIYKGVNRSGGEKFSFINNGIQGQFKLPIVFV